MTDWSEIVDLDQALANTRNDLIRDWYFDPWGWPELDWVVENHPDIVYRRLNSEGVRSVAKLDVAKEGFMTRPAVVMEPVDRLVYQSLVDTISVTLIGDMSTRAFGWRLPDGDATRGDYAANNYQNKAYRERLVNLANIYGAALKTDVTSFFASVPVDRLNERLRQLAGGSAVADRLEDMLDGFGRVDGRSGIPQRSLASCVLANCYMLPVDEVLEEYAPEPTGLRSWVSNGRSARWMDDIWLFGNDPSQLREAQVELQKRMEELGLRMNGGKTDVVEGQENLIREVLSLQHSAVDEDLEGANSLVPLNELIDGLLEAPEQSSRTSVRFATKRMRDYHAFDRVDDFAENAVRMPHASDGLARLFRDSEFWREMTDWFVEYEKSGWGSFDWAAAQFGRMFPTAESPSADLAAHFTDLVLRGDSLALSALCIQRLASWNRDSARQVIRERREVSSKPLERRVLALAALQVGMEAGFVRSMLREFEENTVTLSMIEESGFAPLPVRADFTGD